MSGCGAVFDLHPDKSLGDFVQRIHATKPARDNTGHTRPACIFAICPTAKGCGLSKPGAGLTGFDIKPSCPLHITDTVCAAINRPVVLLAGKWRQGDGPNQLLVTITKNPKEVHHIAVYVVVSLNWCRLTIDENGTRPRERFAIMMALRQQRQQPIEMRELPTIPAKDNAATTTAAHVDDI